MGCKITLTGQAKDIQKLERSVTFYILTGPATKHPPRGLKLFGQTRYAVECTLRQWRRARFDAEDDSDLVVEGYQEPRRDPETGHLYIAVVAMSVQSIMSQSMRKLGQLEEVLEQTREAFSQAKSSGVPRQELEEKAAAFVKANESVASFVEKHPELADRRPS
jgi:hypothetical protein